MKRYDRFDFKARTQSGVAMIEVMVAILIFSAGILGIVGLQATAISQVSDAKYRVDAANLADQLLGQIWADDHTTSVLSAKYGTTDGSGYVAWKQLAVARLPGASSHQPTVSVVADSSDSKRSTVTIKLYWQAPGTTAVHNYAVVSRVR